MEPEPHWHLFTASNEQDDCFYGISSTGAEGILDRLEEHVSLDAVRPAPPLLASMLSEAHGPQGVVIFHQADLRRYILDVLVEGMRIQRMIDGHLSEERTRTADEIFAHCLWQELRVGNTAIGDLMRQTERLSRTHAIRREHFQPLTSRILREGAEMEYFRVAKKELEDDARNKECDGR
jgi:hypothetical protein